MSLTPPIDDYPTVPALLYGAMRMAISAAAFQARHGEWFGDANWDDDGNFMVNNQQGEYGYLRFLDASRCVGVLHSGDPYRPYDVAHGLSQAPSDFVPVLREILASPFINSVPPIEPTALMWSVDGRVASHEPWATFYLYGANGMEEALMPDAAWYECMLAEKSNDAPWVRAILALAHRRVAAGAPVALRAEEATVLLPPDAKGCADAFETLCMGGAWAVCTADATSEGART